MQNSQKVGHDFIMVENIVKSYDKNLINENTITKNI